MAKVPTEPFIVQAEHWIPTLLPAIANMSAEKQEDIIAPAPSTSSESINGKVDIENDGEIFKRGEGYEDFRTVSWIHTSVIFLKRE